MVNVAVGVNTNDAVDQMIAQQNEIEALKGSMNAIMSYLKAKDPNFDASLFDVAPQEDKLITELNNAKLPSENLSMETFKISAFLKANPNILAEVMANAKAKLDKMEVNYNLYEQTRRLVNDEDYLLSVLEEMNK